MAAVGIALAVGVVLVDHELLALGQQAVGGEDGSTDDLFGGPVPHHHRAGIGALGGGQLGVGMVDVVAGTVGEHGVDQMGLHLGRLRCPGRSAGIGAGRLVFEVPTDLAIVDGKVRVDQ